jgi:predicted nucleotidyltransferase
MTTALEIRNCLFEGLNSEAPQGLVEVVYLFGSFACNRQRAESDIDLAFLVAREKYSIDAFECTAPLHMIAAKVGMGLDRVVDVTVLNSASLEIAYEIVAGGECLFERDSERRMQYELKIRGMFFDFRPFLYELRRERLGLPPDYVFRS